MKRLLFVIAVLLAIQGTAQTVWDGTADQSWYDGSQSSFNISTPEQLAGLAQLVNGGNNFSGKTVNLVADIWLNDDTNPTSSNWTPIGFVAASEGSCSQYSGSTNFSGTFNGNYYSIYNLYVNQPYNGAGFFGGLSGATLTKFFLVNPSVTSYGIAGCIAGCSKGGTNNISKVQVINATMNPSCTGNIALFIGATFYGGTTNISNCATSGTINAGSNTNYFGGFCGNGQNAHISNCYAAFTINGLSNHQYAGITAYGLNGTVAASCYSNVNCNSTSNNQKPGTQKTTAEMQNGTFAATLGTAWMEDADNINNGLPVLNPCDAPTGITATAIGPYSADFSWSGSSAATDYDIEWGAQGFTPGTSTELGSDNVATTTFSIPSGLQSSTPYTFAVRNTCNSGGISSWATYNFTTAILCAQPTGLVASNRTGSTIDLSWTGPVNGTSYNIEWGPNDNTWTPGASNAAGSDVSSEPVYQITNLTPATGYKIAVQADCGSTDGESQWTVISSGTTAAETFGNEIWHGYIYAHVNGEQNTFGDYLGYVEEHTQQFSRNDDHDTQPWDGDVASFTSGTGPVDHFGARYKMTKNFDCGNYIFTIDADDYWRLSIDGGATWLPSHRGTTPCGAGNWTTGCCDPWETNAIPLDGTYDLVLEFSEGGGGAYLVVNWAETAITVTAASIEARDAEINFSNGSNWDLIVSLTQITDLDDIPSDVFLSTNTSDNPYFLDDLNPQTAYWVYARPTNCGTAWGATSFQTIILCPQPTGLAASNNTSTTIDLSWAGPANGTSYKIEWGPNDNTWTPGASNAAGSDVSSEPSYQITTLTEATAYKIAVSTDCGSTDGESQWTIISSGTTADETFGEGFWHGYVYNSPSARTFGTNYLGYVEEDSVFDYNAGQGAWGSATRSAATAWVGTAPSDYLAVRYKMKTTLPCGEWTFTIGNDDHVRISADGGVTWLPFTNSSSQNAEGWSTGNGDFTTSTPVISDGITEFYFVFEFTEGTGGAQAKFVLNPSLVPVTVDNTTLTPTSFDLIFSGTELVNYVVSDAPETDPGNLEGNMAGQGYNIDPVDGAVAVSNLTASTTYHIYVQTVCGGAWNHITVTTYANCNAPVGMVYDANSGTLSWNEMAWITDWDIKISTTAINPASAMADIIDNGTSNTNSYIACGLTGSNYYFYVKAQCGTAWASLNHSTAYCAAGSNNGDEHISSVTIANISNSSSNSSNYLDATNVTGNMISGQTYPITVTGSPSYGSDRVQVWIDFNADGDFEDSGESVLITGASSTPWSGNIVIPTITNPVITRMRVRLFYNASSSSACGNTNYGEVEDYTVVLLPNAGCMPPFNITATNITYESATIGWTEPATTPDNGYEIYYTDDCTQTPDEYTAGMIFTPSGNSDVLTGLQASIPYYVWVRANCDNNDYSMWYGPKVFTTMPLCVAPSAFSTANVTHESITVNWTGPASASGYMIEYGKTATFLLGSSENADATSDPAIDLAGLDPLTNYTIAVKTDCGLDGQSSWATYTFWTLPVETFGNGIWHGYVYQGPDTDVPANRFVEYRGFVTEQAQFSRDVASAAWTGETPVWAGAAPDEHFAVRYKMTYDFPCENYIFTLTKVDDAARLSLDGGLTWLSDLCKGADCGDALWNTTSYKNNTYATSSHFLNGPTDLVLEFYEAGGGAALSFQFAAAPISITLSDLTPTSVDLSFAGGNAWDIKVSTTPLANPAEDAGDVSDDATNDNPYALTGLDPETTYYIYVKTDCGNLWGSTTVTTPAACPVPGNLTTVNIGADTATLNWEHYGMTGWNLKVSTTPLTDLDNATGNVFDGQVSTNSYKLTDLDPRTQYYWYVQSNCGSAWSAQIAFTTTQILATLPYICTFESPADNSGWDFNNGTQTNKWMNGSAVNNGGANALYISNNNNNNEYSTNSTSYVYAFRTVNIPATANQLEMAFDWKGTGEDNWDVGRAFLVPLSADITAGNGNSMTGNSNPTPGGWIDIGQGNLQSNNTWNTRITLFAAPAAGLYNIVFFWKNDGSYGDQPPVAIDNVSLMEYTCPVVTSLSVPAASITTHTADITWTAGGTETEWGVKYCPSGADPELVPEDIVYINSYSLSSLESETAYSVYVRARCNADADASRWKPVTFQTLVECEKPVNLQISGITATDAMVSWNPNEDIIEWGIRYFETGTDPNLAVEYTASDTFYSLAGMLTPTTPYTVQVRSHCAGSNSIWVTANFVTMAVETYGNGEWNGYVYSASAYGEFNNFLGTVNEPAQFSRNKTPTSLQAGPWTGVNPNFIGTPPSDAFSARYRMTYNFTGSSYMFIIDADDYFRLSVDGGQTWLPFTRDNTTWTSATTNFWTTSCCAPWHSATVAITGYQDLVLEFYEGGGGAYLDFSFINMDCQAPTNVVVTPGINTADITWTGNPEVPEYELQYKANSVSSWTDPGVEIVPSVTAAPYQLTSLLSNTIYNIRMRSVCVPGSSVDDDFSQWIVYNFQTLCGVGNISDMGTAEGVGNIPWVEYFSYNDAYQGSHNWSANGQRLPDCWTLVYTTGNLGDAPYIHGGNQRLDFCGDFSGGFKATVMPQLPDEVTASQLRMKFWYSQNAGGTYVKVCMVDNPNSTSISDYEVIQQVSTNGDHSISFENYTGSARFIAFVVEDGGGLMDNLRIWIDNSVPVTCTAPTGVTVSAITQTAAIVSWNASATATSYEVEYKPASSSTWIPADMVAAPETSTNLTGLNAEIQYDVRVRSICADNGESTYATASFTTLANPVCNVPTALNHNTVTDISATITWTAGGNETQWQIAWKETANSNWNNSAIVTNEPSHNLSELDAATDYDVRVRAICAAGDTSNWTAIHNFTTLPAPSSCIAPVVSVTDVESTSASVIWTAGGTETHWVLEYGIGSSYDISVAVSTPSPYPLNDLQPNTTYSVRMRAVCSVADTSYYSNVATFTTLQITCNAPDNLHQTTVDEHSISITWTPVNGETEWTVSWAISGSTGNVPVTGSPEYTLTDLLSDTVYQICVRAICSDAVQSPETCIDVRTTGINDIPLASGVKLYPNPASDQLTIEMESRFNTVEVTSTLGQVVYRASLTDKIKVIDVTGYSAGMYYVRLQGDAGTVTKKFVRK